MLNYLPKEIRQENRKKQNDFVEEITTQNKEWVKSRRLEFLSKELKENECQILAINNAISKNCPKWFQEFVFESEMKTFLKKNRKINYEIKIWKAKEYVNLSEIDEDAIENIKKISCSEIIEGECVNRCGGREKYLCMLHHERTPSFVVYIDTNTWHCFGCHEGGDVISLYQKLNKVDFITACKQLKKFL